MVSRATTRPLCMQLSPRSPSTLRSFQSSATISTVLHWCPAASLRRALPSRSLSVRTIRLPLLSQMKVHTLPPRHSSNKGPIELSGELHQRLSAPSSRLSDNRFALIRPSCHLPRRGVACRPHPSPHQHRRTAVAARPSSRQSHVPHRRHSGAF